MGNPIGWFEFYVDDIERARQFYQSVLAVSMEKLGDPTGGDTTIWCFPGDMESYGAAGALMQLEGFSPGGNSVTVYFNCDDCATEESRVVAAGGKIQQSKHSIGEFGFCTLAIDTEGNLFGLHSQK